MAMRSPLPVRDGVGATRLHVPLTGPWPTIQEYVVSRFGHLDPDRLRRRFANGEMVDADGAAVSPDLPLGAREFIWYYREPPAEEAVVPFHEEILYQDADLVVIDKPHFLPTTPGGKFVQSSALVRLRNRLEIPELTPIHRLDRATAGVLMFSARPETRGAYQLLLQDREVEKVYEAVSALPADWDPQRAALGGRPFPITYRDHIDKVRGHLRVVVDPDSPPNAETLVELIGTGTSRAGQPVLHTLLRPHTGRTHQLRVHLAALGAPILHDPFYPVLQPESPDDHARPLQLLARELRFIDPLSQQERVFTTRRVLSEAPVE